MIVVVRGKDNKYFGAFVICVYLYLPDEFSIGDYLI